MIMDKRRYKRITIGFNADINYEGKSYPAAIDNLSETGASIITAPADSAVHYRPGTALNMKFRPCEGETLSMYCTIKWSHEIPPHALTKRVGMEITDPPWDKSGFFL
jgi:hypothetical protein